MQAKEATLVSRLAFLYPWREERAMTEQPNPNPNPEPQPDPVPTPPGPPPDAEPIQA